MPCRVTSAISLFGKHLGCREWRVGEQIGQQVSDRVKKLTKGCRKNGEKRAARTEKRQASAAAGSAAAGSVHGRQAVHVRQAVHGRQAAAGRQDCRQPDRSRSRALHQLDAGIKWVVGAHVPALIELHTLEKDFVTDGDNHPRLIALADP